MAQSLRDRIPGTSALARTLRERIAEVSESDAPILIEGERGSGREMVARLLHSLGPRKGARFVRVDPDEDESQRAVEGELANAHGGTLLVKEVAHVGRGHQRHLARAIRRGPIRRDSREHGPLLNDAHDVRVIAATCVDLERAVADEMFDAELFDRLRATRISVPPLRQRADDVPLLVEYFARIETRELGVDRPVFTARALEKLAAYSWPGNTAELRSVVRRLCVRTRRGPLDVSDVEAMLPPVVERVPAEQLSFEEMVRAKIHALLMRMEGYPLEDLYEEVISRVERPLIELVLERTNNNQVRAAEILGMNRNTLRKKIAARSAKPAASNMKSTGLRGNAAARSPLKSDDALRSASRVRDSESGFHPKSDAKTQK